MSLISARTLAPLAALGATWAARKAMSTVYARRTGHAPPMADDREVSFASVLGWTIATAVVAATIEVVITRAASNYAATHEDFETSSEQLAIPVAPI